MLCCMFVHSHVHLVQVIIRHEMSPLVRISSKQQVCKAVLDKVIGMLATRPEHRIKLLE